MTLCKIIVDYAYTVPTRIGGLNKDTADAVADYVARGFHPEDDQTHPKFDPANAPTEITVDQWLCDFAGVELWCDPNAANGEIEDYRCYFEINDITKPCPFSTEEPPETWETWGVASNGSHAPQEVPEGGGLWYRSNLVGEAGTPLPASQWQGYISNPKTSQTGITRIITVDEYQAIQEANAPVEP